MRALVLVSLMLPLLAAAPAAALPWPGDLGKSFSGGDVQASVQRWTSMQQCMEELSAQLPVEAASQALGTDPLEVICAARQAAVRNDPELCRREVTDYTQRSTCLRFFAIYTGRPQDCPQRGWPSFHEGLCYALANRQPSLCLAAPEAQRLLCLAILEGDRHCAVMAARRRQPCRRETAAWRRLLKPRPPSLPASFRPTLEVRASSAGSGISLPAGASQFKSALLGQGMLLADQAGSGDWFCIDRTFVPQETYRYDSSAPLELELQVPVPSGGTGTASVGGTSDGRAKVSFRETGSYRTLQASTGSVTFTRLERSLAGQLAGTFSLELTDGVDTLKLEGEFQTFVRELIPLSAVAALKLHRSGGTSSYYRQGTPAPAEVQKLRARIHKVKDGLYEVDPSVRDEVLQNTGKLTDSAQISQEHGSKSFRLYSVSRTGLLGLLGFEERDLLRKINGKAMESREDFFEAYGKLRKAPIITVLLDRGGTEIKLTYRFTKLASKPTKKTS